MEVMRHVLLQCVCVCACGVGVGPMLLSMARQGGERTSDVCLECPVFQEHMGQAPSLLWAQEVPWPNSVQTAGREGFSLNTHKTSPPECLWAQVPAVSL